MPHLLFSSSRAAALLLLLLASLIGTLRVANAASPSVEVDSASGALYYEWELEETAGAPDGIAKTILTVNGEFPGPTIRGVPGQEVYVKLINKMTHATTMHWHGLKMKDNFWYDGVPWASQCPIEPGETFIYQFYLEDTPGTHWYHSHFEAQRADGTFGAIVIEEAESSSSSGSGLMGYDRDEVINLHDWFHETYEELEKIVVTNPWDFGSGPFTSDATKSILVNGMGEYTDPATGVTTGSKYNFEVDNGERVLYRFYNSASRGFFRIEFQSHVLVIIGKDGHPTKPYAVQRLDINAGERYDAILHANQGSGTYAFLISPIMVAPCTGYDGGFTDCQQFTHTLTYTTAGAASDPITDFDEHFNPRKLKSTTDLPEELKTLYPDATIVFDARLPERPITGAGNAGSFFDANGNPQFGFLSWELNKKQSIKLGPQYKAVPIGESYPNDNVYNFPKGTVLDVVFQTYSLFRGSVEQHPWHYHGHSWYVLGWGEGAFNYLENKGDLNFEDPHIADTTTVYGESNPGPGMNFVGPAVSIYPDYEDWNRGTRGWVLVRVVLDNPGTWIAHCHQEWHVAEGMYAFIGVGTLEDLEEAAPKSEAFSAIDDFPECPASREGVAQLSESSSGVFSGMAITDGEKSSGRDSGNRGSSSSEWGGSSANLRAANRGASFGYLGVDSSSNQAGFSEVGDSSNALPAAFNPSHSDSGNADGVSHSLGGGPSD